MSRVKGGTVTHARHKKIVDQAKGYYGRRKNTFKVAAQAVDKANQYATRGKCIGHCVRSCCARSARKMRGKCCARSARKMLRA